MIKTLKYYSKDGTLTEFTKYTIDTNGVIRNKKGEQMTYIKQGAYNAVTMYDDIGKQRKIGVPRAIASTFIGSPPTPEHTADHIDRNPNNDTLDNLQWLCKSGQSKNRCVPVTYKFAFIVIRDDEEKTAKEWSKYLKDDKNHLGREYTHRMILNYAQKKQNGFSYKVYPDLQDEVWKEIIGSKTSQGYWEISNMNRVKHITNHAEHVLSGERLGLDKGYPIITINGKHRPCHILSFMTFFPEKYVARKLGEIVLHEDDDKLDFRPHKLRLGSQSDNRKDAYDNGKYDGTKSSRFKCASYINDVLEQEYESQNDAERYLKSKGYKKASCANIRSALNGTYNTAYGRTWKRVD